MVILKKRLSKKGAPFVGALFYVLQYVYRGDVGEPAYTGCTCAA